MQTRYTCTIKLEKYSIFSYNTTSPSLTLGHFDLNCSFDTSVHFHITTLSDTSRFPSTTTITRQVFRRVGRLDTAFQVFSALDYRCVLSICEEDHEVLVHQESDGGGRHNS